MKPSRQRSELPTTNTYRNICTDGPVWCFVNLKTITSACMELGHEPTQMGDVGRVTDGLILETASAPWDNVCEAHSVFCGRPWRARLRIRKPARKRPMVGTRPSRGRLKWRRWCEFGKHVAPCDHVHRGRHDARSESRERDDTASSFCVASFAGRFVCE